MRKIIGLAGFCVMLFLMGCASVDPLSLPITQRDEESYDAAGEKKIAFQKHKVVIKSIVGEERNDKKHDAFIVKAAETAVSRYLSNLGWFKPLNGQSGIVLDSTGEFDEKKSSVADDVSFLLVVESRIVCIGWPYWQDRGTVDSGKATGVRITTDFKVFDRNSKVPVLVRSFQTKVPSEKGRLREAIAAALDENASKFAKVTATRLLPPVRVLETRGSGRCALVALGKNYMAEAPKDGESGTKVEFFYTAKTDDVGGSAYSHRVFARGEVISVNKNQAWVEVENPAAAGVKKGHLVKLADSDSDAEEERK